MKNTRKNHHGFTLVELAIALMIIGLLIAGVLKGQELVENARAAQWVQQLNSYEVAVKAFRLAYDALPGDMGNATTRLPNCSAPCANGIENKQIGNYAHPPNLMGIAASSIGEQRNFWIHLANAGLISGVSPTYSGVWSAQPGVELPKGPSKNSMISVNYYWGGNNNANVTWGDAPSFRNGNYYMLRNVVETSPALAPRTAFYIDEKLDDGKPTFGLVRGLNPMSGCTSGSEYSMASANPGCNLMVWVK